MANSLGGNPWSLDTVNTGLVFTGDVHITQIQWRDFTGGGGQVVNLTDAAGRTVFRLATDVTTPNPTGTSFGTPSIAHGGIKLPTLDSGVLEIYLS